MRLTHILLIALLPIVLLFLSTPAHAIVLTPSTVTVGQSYEIKAVVRYDISLKPVLRATAYYRVISGSGVDCEAQDYTGAPTLNEVGEPRKGVYEKTVTAPSTDGLYTVCVYATKSGFDPDWGGATLTVSCECYTGPCCDGCNFKPADTVCGYSDWNGCSATGCARKRDVYECTGTSATCPATDQGDDFENCPLNYRCDAAAYICVSTGACGYGPWDRCSADRYRVRDMYRCDGSDRCNYDVGDDTNDCGAFWCQDSCTKTYTCKDGSCGSYPFYCLDSTCTGAGVCDSGTACGTGGYECKDACTRGRRQYRCDGAGTCNNFWQWTSATSCDPFRCSGNACSNVCEADCGADAACDGWSPGDSCGANMECDADCKCVESCAGLTEPECDAKAACSWCTGDNSCKPSTSVDCQPPSCNGASQYCSNSCQWTYCSGTYGNCYCSGGSCASCFGDQTCVGYSCEDNCPYPPSPCGGNPWNSGGCWASCVDDNAPNPGEPKPWCFDRTPNTGYYCSAGTCCESCPVCCGSDDDCGIYPGCVNCDASDGCDLGYYKGYYCAGTSCDYSSTCTEACCDAYHGDSNAYCSAGICNSPIPPTKPDLIITDTWNESTTIYYTIKNQGDASADWSYSDLYVDGSYKKRDYAASLSAGSSRTEYFLGYTWSCSGTSDKIKVCADGTRRVSESDEGNNCREETWSCPGTTTTTSTTTTTIPPCSDTGLGTPIVSPSSPTEGISFQVYCPVSAGWNCIAAYANDWDDRCTWSQWDSDNKRHVFDCAGMPAGGYTARCVANTGTSDNCCYGTKTGSYTVTSATTTSTIPSGCVGGVPNGICEADETQDNCGPPNGDCYTTVTIYPETSYPGQEVTVTIYFNDSRYEEGGETKIELMIDDVPWNETNGCVMGDKRMSPERKPAGWKKMVSKDLHFKIVATCTIPSDLPPGKHTLKAVPTVYSSPVTLRAAEIKITILDGLANLFNYVKSFFSQFTGQFVRVLYG